MYKVCTIKRNMKKIRREKVKWIVISGVVRQRSCASALAEVFGWLPVNRSNKQNNISITTKVLVYIPTCP